MADIRVCTCCKCRRRAEEFDTNRLGETLKTCNYCRRKKSRRPPDSRAKDRCVHDRQRRRCAKCNLSSTLMARLGSRINRSIGSVQLTLSDILGCNAEDLITHLEENFKGTQSWENYGQSWHMDHVIALNAPGENGEPTLLEKIARHHWTNLQPLDVSDHKVKSVLDLREMREAGYSKPGRPKKVPQIVCTEFTDSDVQVLIENLL